MHVVNLKQSKVNLKKDKTIKKGNLYIAGSHFDNPLQFAVCLGFTDIDEPYFYLFGALKGCFTKNSNSIVAWTDIDFMKAMLEPIVKYEFCQAAEEKSFLRSVHIYDINIGQIPIDIDVWYLKQKMLMKELPTLKSEQIKLKPVGKRDLKVGEIYITQNDIYGNNIKVYLGYIDNEFKYYSLSKYQAFRIVQHNTSLNTFSIKSTKTKPKFYAFDDIKDILSPDEVKACIELKKCVSDDIRKLYMDMI